MTSGGNNFNDFPENQLSIDFAFLCSLLGGTLLYHHSPLFWYHLGERHSPPPNTGEWRSPHSPSTTPIVMSCTGWAHEMEARTVPLMQMRQIGHRCSCWVQSAQQTKWPQGRNTMLTSASIHTLHVLSSFSFSFSSSMCVVGTEPKHAVNFYNTQLLSMSTSTPPAIVTAPIND